MKRWRPSTRVILNAAAVWELLDRLDLSQNEMARRCGITSGHLSHLMNGRRSPSPGVRRRLMEVLGADDFHIYGGTGNDTYNAGAGTDEFYYTSGNDITADCEACGKIWVCIGNVGRDETIAQADSGSDRVITITHNNAAHGTISLTGQANIETAAAWSDPNAARSLSATTEGRAPAVSANTGSSRYGGSNRGCRTPQPSDAAAAIATGARLHKEPTATGSRENTPDVSLPTDSGAEPGPGTPPAPKGQRSFERHAMILVRNPGRMRSLDWSA